MHYEGPLSSRRTDKAAFHVPWALLLMSLELGGSLKRSARAVQLFGRLAVLDTHSLRY